MEEFICTLIGALVGGGCSIFATMIANKHQQKIIDQNRKFEVRPWLVSFDENQDYNMHEARNYPMEADGVRHSGKEPFSVGVVKNVGNSVVLLEYLQSENVKYIPTCGNVVEKDGIVNLLLFLGDDTKESLREWKLYVKDIYGNRYCYTINNPSITFKLGDSQEAH